MQKFNRFGRLALLAQALILSTGLGAFAQSTIDPSHYRMPTGGFYMPDPSDPLKMVQTENLQEALDAWRNDREFQGERGWNWGPRALGAELMYALGITGRGEKAGTIDTGAHAVHPEFTDEEGNPNVVGVDINVRRAIDDISGHATPGSDKAGDEVLLQGGLGWVGSDHGTHVMGIIVGGRNNKNVGPMAQGVAFGAIGYAAQGEGVGPAEGPGDTLDPAIYSASVAALIDMGVSVINNSWGMKPYGTNLGHYGRPQVIQQFVTAKTGRNYQAIQNTARRGVVTVFAAGNNLRSAPSEINGYPYFANDPVVEQHFLTVLNGRRGSDGMINSLSSSSNICGYTKYYCVVAPGDNILSPTNSLDGARTEDGIHLVNPLSESAGHKTGTSMAAPAAAGSFLLLKERFYYLSNGQVLDILKGTADRRLNRNGEVDENVGMGIIDLAAAARGPRELFGVLDFTLDGDDLWSNDMTQAALNQRRAEERGEILKWDGGINSDGAVVESRRAFLEKLLAGTPEEAKARVTEFYRDKYSEEFDEAVQLVTTMLSKGSGDLQALAAVREHETASALFGHISRAEKRGFPAAFLLARHQLNTPEGKQRALEGMLSDRKVDNSTARDNIGMAEAWANENKANKTEELMAELAFMTDRVAHLKTKEYLTAVIKRGTGTLEMSGNNTYDGTTYVLGGTINLSGSTVSASEAATGGTFRITETGRAADVAARAGGTVIVNGTAANGLAAFGGVLGGSGTLETLRALAGGTISPGNSIGVLTVTGNATFDVGSIYRVEINDTQSDLLKVGGTADLAGTVEVSREGQIEALKTNELAGHSDTQYTILTAGAVNGTFDAAIPDGVFVGANLAYGANDVSMRLGRNDVSFSSVATTANARASGGAIEALGLGNAVHDAVVTMESADLVQKSFALLSGEIHPSAQSVLALSSEATINAVTDRLRSSFGHAGASYTPVLAYAGGDTPRPVAADTTSGAIWWDAYGSWARTDGDGNATPLSHANGGLVFGADNSVGDWRVGLVGGYGNSSFKANQVDSSGKSNTYQLGLYGGTEWGDLAFRTGSSLNWHDVTTTRNVNIPGLKESLTAGYGARSWQTFAELGYNVSLGATVLEPFVNLTHVSFSADGFVEQGGAAALSVSATNSSLTFTTLGVRGEHDLMLGQYDATFKGAIGWKHALGDVATTTSAAFANSPAFTVTGAPIMRDSVAVEAGLDLKFKPNATFGIGYTGQFASGHNEHGIKASLAVAF